MKRSDLKDSQYHPYYNVYLDLLEEDQSLFEGLLAQKDKTIAFYNQIPAQKHSYAYDQGKWTIKEVLQHIVDTERMFAYRAFRMGRHDNTPLMGFEQDDYIAPSAANSKDMNTLLKEYKDTREATLSLFSSFSNADLNFVGTASNVSSSAAAIGFIIVAHELWHQKIIEERYL